MTTIDISSIAGADAPTTYNEKGAGQSHVPARFDLVDGKAMFAMAAVLHEGAEKYGANNWRGISIDDHLNHLIMHAYAYLSGDRSDAHLSHIMCRAMFAQAVNITETETKMAVMEHYDAQMADFKVNHPGVLMDDVRGVS